MPIPKLTALWAIAQSAPGGGDRPNAGIEVRSLTTKAMRIADDKNYQRVCVISAALFKIATNFFSVYASQLGQIWLVSMWSTLAK
uniref:hypothetical protein n=1 Tax=Scytonema sp. HK-05 TaxID=1137095 RepID=UPI000BBBDF3B